MERKLPFQWQHNEFREAFGAPEPERPAPVVVAEDENDREGDDEDWRNVELPEGVTLR